MCDVSICVCVCWSAGWAGFSSVWQCLSCFYVFLNRLIVIISHLFDMRRYDWTIRRGCGDGTGAVEPGRRWLSWRPNRDGEKCGISVYLIFICSPKPTVFFVCSTGLILTLSFILIVQSFYFLCPYDWILVVNSSLISNFSLWLYRLLVVKIVNK